MNVAAAPAPRKTIVLADDHRMVREGLRVLLEAGREFSVVADAGDGLTALALVERLQPDVLLLDLMMPGLDGQEVARRAARCAPKTRVVILSMHSSEPYVIKALRNGVAGYVMKDTSGADLIHALHEVLAGRRYLSPPLSEHAIDAYQEKTRTVAWERYDTLTARERETLQLVAEGLTNHAIARRLGIGERTAETHRSNLMRKLQMHTPAELVKYAIERGILPLAPK
jgi:DNA-binding NarL/FixJ family response regulator